MKCRLKQLTFKQQHVGWYQTFIPETVKPRRIKKGASYSYRTATTSYPCFVPDLGELRGSWSYKTYPAAKL